MNYTGDICNETLRQIVLYGVPLSLEMGDRRKPTS